MKHLKIILIIEKSIETFKDAVIEAMSEPDMEEPEKTLGETKGEEQIREDIKEGIIGNVELFNDSIRIAFDEIIDNVNNYLNKYFQSNIEISLDEGYEFVSLNESGTILEKRLVFNYKYFNNEVNEYAYSTFLNEARLSALAICIYLSAVKQDIYSEYKILFFDDIFIGLDNSNRKPLIDILLEDFKEFQIFITTYDRYWYEMAKSYTKNWEYLELYVGHSDKLNIEYPVILKENLDSYSKAIKYFNSYDYFSSGNNLRKAIEKQIEHLVPKTYLITENDLEGYFDKLIKYYEENNCSDLIDSQLREDLYIFKDVVLNPASHNDLKSPIYKSEVERAIKIVEKVYALPLLRRVPILYMGDFLYYYNYEKDYRAQYIAVDNVYSIEIEGQVPRITIPNHKLLTYSFRKKTFIDNAGKKLSDSRIISLKNDTSKLTERPGKIQHFLSLSELPDWQKEFKSSAGFSLKSIQNRIFKPKTE